MTHRGWRVLIALVAVAIIGAGLVLYKTRSLGLVLFAPDPLTGCKGAMWMGVRGAFVTEVHDSRLRLNCNDHRQVFDVDVTCLCLKVADGGSPDGL